MRRWKSALTLLACLHAALAFNCPDDSHAFYHADVATGCTVYHHCQNSQLQTFTCPAGKAFNHLTSQCDDASTVECIETMDDHSHHHHHHHKRAIEEYHVIDIKEFKNKLIDAYHSIKPVLKDIAKSIAPSMYKKFEESYLPAIRAAQQDVMPFFYEKVYPEVKKWFRYSLGVIGKVIEKLYKSYQLSNSTHITVVSMTDIAEEISNDLQPVFRLGRFLSTKLLENKDRVKRSAEEELPEEIRAIFEPLVNSIDIAIIDSFLGGGNNFISKVVIPGFYEMISNEETRYDVLSVFLSAKAAFSPVAREMMNIQPFNTPEGTVIKVPKKFYTTAIEQFLTETRPVIRRLTKKHLLGLYKRATENAPLLEKSFNYLEDLNCPHAAELKVAVLNFIAKHSEIIQTPADSHMTFYPLPEVLEDLKPIKEILYKVFREYFDSSESYLVKYLFGSSLKKDMYTKPYPKAKYEKSN